MRISVALAYIPRTREAGELARFVCFILSVEAGRFVFVRSHHPERPILPSACAFVKSVRHAGFSFTGIIASTDIGDSVYLARELFPEKHQNKSWAHQG